jgi:hypothetical protein
MKMKITKKNLINFLGIDYITALKIMEVIRSNEDTLREKYSEAERRYRECYNHPGIVDLKMNVLNKLIDGCGVEAINHPDDYRGDNSVEYVNMGDTYESTICHDNRTGKFLISCWGDFFESDPERFCDDWND